MADSPETIREEINAIRRRLDELEKVLTGDPAWKRKGVLERLEEMAAVMKMLENYDFAGMKSFMVKTEDMIKRVLTISAFLAAVGSIAWIIIINASKILDLIPHK